MIDMKSTSALEAALVVYAQRKRWTTPTVITSDADNTNKPANSFEFTLTSSSAGPS